MILKFKLNTRRTIYYPHQQLHSTYIFTTYVVHLLVWIINCTKCKVHTSK